MPGLPLPTRPYTDGTQGLRSAGSSGSGAHGNAEADDDAGGAPVEVGELLFGSGQAHLQPFHPAEPSFAFGLGDVGDEVVADLDEPSGWAGSCQSIRQRTQACSWMHGMPNARPHAPIETLHRSK